MSRQPTLGIIPGMTWDPERNRYFPTPPTPAPRPPPRDVQCDNMRPPSRAGNRSGSSTPMLPTDCFENAAVKSKRLKIGHLTPNPPSRAGPSRLPRSDRKCQRDKSSPAQRATQWEEKRLSNLSYENRFTCGGCHGERITSIKTFAGNAFWATTDHGKVIIHRSDGETHAISICSSGLAGLHMDIARMTMAAIAGGPEAHAHHFRRDPDQLLHVFMEHSELDLPQGDIYSMSSFDDICSLGGSKCITSLNYTSTNRLQTSKRSLTSDPLALHHQDRNVIFAGLRNGTVVMEDLRTRWQPPNAVGHTLKQKAVVRVKRLQDSAVPWGLLVSGMGDELLIYDIRYPKQPLRELQGHINTYHSDLGLDTSHDDRYLFAAGSDKRLRLFNTVTGDRIIPKDPHYPKFMGKIGPDEVNPLRKIFNSRIEHISVRPDDLGVHIAAKGDVWVYSAKSPKNMIVGNQWE